MSTVIDHAISIPAHPKLVWTCVSNPANNPIWQADIETVAFLTTKHSGKGTRWRSRTGSGSEQVIEITAWYEGLGYEYVIVDGTPLENTRGRIRLQEVPEGTVVQWTFNYEISGMFSGLRNSLMTRGRLDDNIVQSLRNLYAYIKETKETDFTIQDSKSLMREAPDVQARSHYQSRHPSVTRQETPTLPPSGDDLFKPPAHQPQPDAVPSIPEPAFDDDDTRPNPAVQEQDVLDESEAAAPHEPQPAAEAPASDDQLPEWARPRTGEEQQPAEEPSTKTQETAPPARTEQPEPTALEEEKEAEREPEQVQEHTEAPISKTDTLETTADISELDSAQISVFEIFGLEKPSETSRMRAITDEEANTSPVSSASSESQKASAVPFDTGEVIVPDIDPEASSSRTGLRAKLRRRLARIRRP